MATTKKYLSEFCRTVFLSGETAVDATPTEIAARLNVTPFAIYKRMAQRSVIRGAWTRRLETVTLNAYVIAGFTFEVDGVPVNYFDGTARDHDVVRHYVAKQGKDWEWTVDSSRAALFTSQEEIDTILSNWERHIGRFDVRAVPISVVN